VTNDDFETARPELVQLAYAMLGSIAEAEEVVQDAWVKSTPVAQVQHPRAFLRTVVTRLALDRLRSAKARREVYPGPWLPEPVFTETPEDRSALAQAVQMATLVVLEQLSPVERAAFLLREVFDMEYAELARLLDRSPPAVRQIVSRARRTVRARRRPSPDPAMHAVVLGQLVQAVQTGDLAAATALLAPDCSFTSDGGGRVPAATRVVRGADAVARLLVGLAHRFGDGVVPTLATLNHQPALLLWRGDVLEAATVFTIAHGRLLDIHQLRNPDKLRHLHDTPARRPAR
jgi:RNA polymerase sigma-70 factor (ECF subfamily)